MDTRLKSPWIDRLASGAARLRQFLRLSAQTALLETLNQAFAGFRRLYPAWEQYLFDEYFVRTVAAPMFARAGVSSAPNAAALAEAWAEQMSWTSLALRQKHTAALLPAAQDFIRLVRCAT